MPKDMGYYPESLAGITHDTIVMHEKPMKKEPEVYALNPHDASELEDEQMKDEQKSDKGYRLGSQRGKEIHDSKMSESGGKKPSDKIKEYT